MCFVNTIPSEDKDSKRCIFPFSFEGKTYIDCTADHSSNEAEWCATEVKSNGEVVRGQWGDCDKKSLTCLTIGAGTPPRKPAPQPAAPRINPPRPAPRPVAPPPRRPVQQPPPRPRPPPSNEVSPKGQQVCFVNTVSTEEKDPKICIFPFSFRGKTYTDCTTDHSTNKVEWCATEIKQDGEVLDGKWGDCDRKSLTCVTIGGEGTPRGPPQQRPPPQSFQGLPPGFPPQGFEPRQGLPRGPPPSGANGQNRPPPRGPPPRSFPQGQRPPPRNNAQRPPQPKSALPPQFQFNPSDLFALAAKLAGGGGKIDPNANPGSQKAEESFGFKEEVRSSLKTFWDDEAWPEMWYLNRGGKGMDMNVEDAWAQGTYSADRQ